MKKILISILFLLLSFPASALALDVGDNAPDFIGITLDGRKIAYSDLKGKKPLYLIFWATWCPNCKREVPKVVEMHKKFGNKVEFIGINVGINERIDGVKQYVKTHGMSFSNLFDSDGRIIKAFGIMGTPTHIIIDRKGTIRYRGADLPVDLGKHLKELEG